MGGPAADIGLTQALEKKFAEEYLGMQVRTHRGSITLVPWEQRFGAPAAIECWLDEPRW